MILNDLPEAVMDEINKAAQSAWTWESRLSPPFLTARFLRIHDTSNSQNVS